MMSLPPDCTAKQTGTFVQVPSTNVSCSVGLAAIPVPPAVIVTIAALSLELAFVIAIEAVEPHPEPRVNAPEVSVVAESTLNLLPLTAPALATEEGVIAPSERATVPVFVIGEPDTPIPFAPLTATLFTVPLAAKAAVRPTNDPPFSQ